MCIFSQPTPQTQSQRAQAVNSALEHHRHQPAQMFKQEGSDMSRSVSRRTLQLKVEEEIRDGARAEVEALSITQRKGCGA